jgi:hypothetical protein
MQPPLILNRHYNQSYHQTAIAKIQWFIVGIAHLYNAVRQIDGLGLSWPDLDFIIEAQGPGRIFRGGPPTDPNDFLNCYLLSGSVSLAAMVSDFPIRHTGKYLPRVSRAARAKRGLMSETPLERLIYDFYGSDLKHDRWVERHAILHHLHEQKEASGSTSESGEVSQKLKDLRAAFAALVTKVSPPKPRRKGKNKDKVKNPDFKKQDETYPGLFETMREELQSQELHSNFDYLSFYRRAYDLILRIREEVLFSNEVQVYRNANVAQDQTPTNSTPDNSILLTDLFGALQIQPKTKKEMEAEAEGPGQELSTQVVPLKQLIGVGDLMAALIREKGSTELERAKLRHGRKWDDLKAYYEAEKWSVPTPPPAPTPEDMNDAEEALIYDALSKITVGKDDGDHPWFFANPDIEAEPSDQVDEASSLLPPEPEQRVKQGSSAQPSTPLDNHSKTDDPKPDEVQAILDEDSTQDAPVAEPQAGVGDDKTTTLPTWWGIRIYLGKQVRGVDDDGAPDKRTKPSRTWKDTPDDPKLLFGADTLRLAPEQAVANKGSWLDKTECSVPKILDSLTKLTSEKAVVLRSGDDEVRTAGSEAQILQPVDSSPHQASHFDASDVDWVELAVELADKQYHIVKTPTTEVGEPVKQAPRLSQSRRLLEYITGNPLELVSNNVFRSLHPALFEAVKSIGEGKSIHDIKRTKEKKPTQKVKFEEEFKPSSLIVKLRVPPTKPNELLMNLRVSEELAKLVEPTAEKPARERSTINRFLDDANGKPLKIVRNNIFASLIQPDPSEHVQPDESATPIVEVEAAEQIKPVEEVTPVGQTKSTEEVEVVEEERPNEDIKPVEMDRNNIYRNIRYGADILESIEQDNMEKTEPIAEGKLAEEIKVVEEGKPTTPIEETKPAPTSKPKKHTRLPNGIFHTITYFSTTSRKYTTTTKSSKFSKLPPTKSLTNFLTRARRKRGLFHRLTEHKHRVAFSCYTQCAMARALHGKTSRLQRQMALAVAALKQTSRRDLAELERVWRWAGEEEAGRVETEWETESEGSVD